MALEQVAVYNLVSPAAPPMPVSLDLDTVTATEENTTGDTTIYKITVDAAGGDGQLHNVAAYLNDDGRVFFDQEVAALLTPEPARPSEPDPAATSMSTSDSAPPPDAGFTAAYEELAAQSPVYVYCQENTDQYRAYDRIAWAPSTPTKAPNGTGWTVTSALTVNGKPVGEHSLSIVASGGRHYLYAPKAVLEHIDAALTAAEPGPAAPRYDYPAVESYLQGLRPVPIYCTENRAQSRNYDSVSWTPPSSRTAEGTRWSFTTTLRINGSDAGEHTVTIEESGGQYYLFVPRAAMEAGDKAPAAARPTLDFDTSVQRLLDAHERESVVYIGSNSQPERDVAVDWETLRRAERTTRPAGGWLVTVRLRDTAAEDWQEIADTVLDALAQPARIQLPQGTSLR